VALLASRYNLCRGLSLFIITSPLARSPLLCPSRSPAANGRLCLRGPPAAAGLPGGAAAGARGAGGRGGDARAGVRRRAAVEALRGVRDGGRGARAAPLLLPGGVGARPRQGPRRALAQRRPGLLQLRRLRLRARYYIFFLAFVASPLGPRGPRAPGQSQGLSFLRSLLRLLVLADPARPASRRACASCAVAFYAWPRVKAPRASYPVSYPVLVSRAALPPPTHLHVL
jgi:hypothetical protein